MANEIKVGDMVVFYVDGNKPPHKGQVIGFVGDECDVYCQTEMAVYRVKTEKCRKI